MLWRLQQQPPRQQRVVVALLLSSSSSRQRCSCSILATAATKTTTTTSRQTTPEDVVTSRISFHQQQQPRHIIPAGSTTNTITHQSTKIQQKCTQRHLSSNTRRMFLSTKEHSDKSEDFGTTTTTTQDIMSEILSKTFDPIHLEIINESYMHNVPADSETHFKVIIVSEKFESCKTLIQRHRMINNALSEQFDTKDGNGSGTIHALSIVAKTPKQWQDMTQDNQHPTVPPSPSCRGGDGSLPSKKEAR